MVSFTDTPTSDLACELIPVWDRAFAAHHDTDRATLAVLARGLDLGFTAAAIGRQVRHADRDIAFVGTARWHRLVSEARRHRKAVSSPPAVALAVARAGVGHLLAPTRTELSPRAEQSSRTAFAAVLDTALIEARRRGFDTFFLTAGHLAGLTGVSVVTARRQLATMRSELGWLSVASKRGTQFRYRIGQLRAGVETETAWEHSAAIDALAAGSFAGDELAATVATAAHAAWGFSPPGSLTPRHLLAALSGLSGVSLGLSARTRSKLLRELSVELPGLVTIAGLGSELDVYGGTSGAFEAQAVRLAELRAESEEHARTMSAFREKRAAENVQKASVRKAIAKAEGTADVSQPRLGDADDRAQLNGYVTSMRRVMAGRVPAELAQLTRDAFVWQLSEPGGWPADIAEKAAAHILPEADREPSRTTASSSTSPSPSPSPSPSETVAA